MRFINFQEKLKVVLWLFPRAGRIFGDTLGGLGGGVNIILRSW